jgi:hypothetical protein
MEWKEFKKKRFKENPKLKEEYDKLELEYKIKSQIIDLRRKKKLTQKNQKEKNKKSDADLLERLKRGSSDANNKKGRFV